MNLPLRFRQKRNARRFNSEIRHFAKLPQAEQMDLMALRGRERVLWFTFLASLHPDLSPSRVRDLMPLRWASRRSDDDEWLHYVAIKRPPPADGYLVTEMYPTMISHRSIDIWEDFR